MKMNENEERKTKTKRKKAGMLLLTKQKGEEERGEIPIKLKGEIAATNPSKGRYSNLFHIYCPFSGGC